MRFVRENGLSLAFGALFLAALVAQAFVGHADFNAQQLAHNGDPISMWRFLRSSEFGVDVLENWQSEYLQFSLFIFGTVWLIQRGSPESKEPGKAGLESDEQQRVGRHATELSPAWARAGGWRRTLYSNSLLLVMGAIWLASWLGQSITGRVAFNAERFDHRPSYVSSVAAGRRTLPLALGALVRRSSQVPGCGVRRQRRDRRCGFRQLTPLGALGPPPASLGWVRRLGR
jgi:hypothetical protein